jgi:hypothetical protein
MELALYAVPLETAAFLPKSETPEIPTVMGLVTQNGIGHMT